MNLRHLTKIALGVLLFSLASSAAVALETAGSTPKGAVKLTQSKLREKTGYYCGQVRSRWIPGRLLSRTTFYPADAELPNLAADLKKASGLEKAELRKRIAEMKSTLSSRRLHCSAIARSGTKTRLTKVLRTRSEKWSRFQSIRRVSRSSSPTPPMVRPETSGIILNVNHAVALAQPETPSGSNLLAVSRDGATADALLTGSAVINDFYSSPNGKIYLVFQTKVPLVDGGEPCLLAEVDSNTGVPTCVDSSLDSIAFTSQQVSAGPIQFDDAGNLFYTGSKSGRAALRRYSKGQVSNLINDNIWLQNFLVMPDGSVILTGSTLSTGRGWLRRLSPSGSLSSIITSDSALFLLKFPDGNAYFGLEALGVRRFLASSRSLDPRFWFGTNQTWPLPPPYFAWESCQGSCGWVDEGFRAAYNTPNAETYVVGGSLVQYYPVVEKQDSAVTNILISQAAGKKVLLSGFNQMGQNITTLFNLETKVETVVVNASNEIEMYNLTYAKDINKILFDGLRFSDNQYVVGEIDLSE